MCAMAQSTSECQGSAELPRTPKRELLRITLPRLYEKWSNAGESPRHETNHCSVHQRFATRTQPPVVLAHPPLLVDPRQCPLHHPPPRQNQVALWGQQFPPIHHHILLGPLRSPRHQHLFRDGPFRALDEVHTPPQSLSNPVRAFALAAVARVHPQVREAGEQPIRPPQQLLDPL